MASDPPGGEVDTCTLKQTELYLVLTNQTQQPYPHVLDIARHMLLSLDGISLLLAWHTPDILIRSQSTFWSPIVWCYPHWPDRDHIPDHDRDEILIAIILLLAGHMVCSTPT